ncbi:hypothetical protein OG455_31725 [Kitasatospora sp. NBC_01287]|uniref:hypothetical protein n=1 Tax=Kitasatospora sp. NBC_01287 TaxID=2903573 RepID=UPI0022521877|nr:hypothetical protein [Kitasatospora sp. NBC_01287]MCX4750036.1 hypothetical protein [Kitasatospora sp. NBC_01287]
MSTHRPHLRRWITGLLGAGAASMLVAVPAHAASSVDGTISPTEVIQRAQSWVSEGVPYNQAGYQSDSNGTYREDCSGFVSMAWHLSDSLVTQTLPSVSTQISSSQLQPGDALDYTDEHVILFGNWIDQSAGTFNYYSEQNSRVLTNEYQGDLNASSVAGWPTSYYTPLRYDKISGAAPTTTTPAPAPTTPTTPAAPTTPAPTTGTGTAPTAGSGSTPAPAHSGTGQHTTTHHNSGGWNSWQRWW